MILKERTICTSKQNKSQEISQRCGDALSHPTSTGVLHCSLHVQCTTATFTQLAGHLNNAFEVLMISSPILSNINISLRFLFTLNRRL